MHGMASWRQPMTRPALLALLLHNVQQVDVDDFDVFQRLVCPVRLGLLDDVDLCEFDQEAWCAVRCSQHNTHAVTTLSHGVRACVCVCVLV
jgi:hypothetical protein